MCKATLVCFQITLPSSKALPLHLRTNGGCPSYHWRRPFVPMEAALRTNGGGPPYQRRLPSVPMEAALRTNGGGPPYQWRPCFFVPMEAALRTNGGGPPYQWRPCFFVPMEAALRTNGGGPPYQWRRHLRANGYGSQYLGSGRTKKPMCANAENLVKVSIHHERESYVFKQDSVGDIIYVLL
jgi:hypothetical protein